MKMLKEMLSKEGKTVFVYAENPETSMRFLLDAENEGFIWSDGSKPTDKPINNFYAVHPDMTINYIGTNGRIAFQTKSDSIIRIDYKDYLKKK